MSELQKDILLVFLQSQLEIERAKLRTIEQWNNQYIHQKVDWNICSNVIEEIERQINIIKTHNGNTTTI